MPLAIMFLFVAAWCCEVLSGWVGSDWYGPWRQGVDIWVTQKGHQAADIIKMPK